jgi:hypothetical protein
MKSRVALTVFLLTSGCDGSAMKNEAANKSENSILQYFEYECRETRNDKPFLIFERALDTDAVVVAFPIKGQPRGYVVMFAQREGRSDVKLMPDVEFVVTQEAYLAVKKKTPLSKNVDKFISLHVP